MKYSTREDVFKEIQNILANLSSIRSSRPRLVMDQVNRRQDFKVTQPPDIQGFWDQDFDGQLLLTAEALTCFTLPAWKFPESIIISAHLPVDQIQTEVERIINWVEKDGFSAEPYLQLRQLNPQGEEYQITDTAAFVLSIMRYILELNETGRLNISLDLTRVEGCLQHALEFLLSAHTGLGWAWTKLPQDEFPAKQVSNLYFTYSVMASLREINFQRASIAGFRDRFEEVRRATRSWIEEEYLPQLLDPEDTGIIAIDRMQNLIANAYALGTLLNCDYGEIEIVNKIIDIWLSCYEEDLRTKQFHKVLTYTFRGKFTDGSQVIEEFEDTTILPVYLTVCLDAVLRRFCKIDKLFPMINNLTECIEEQKLQTGIFAGLYGGGGARWGRGSLHAFEMCFTERTIEFLCSLAEALEPSVIKTATSPVEARTEEDGTIVITVTPRTVNSSPEFAVNEIIHKQQFDMDDAQKLIDSLDLNGVKRDHIYRLCMLYNLALDRLDGRALSEKTLGAALEKISADIKQRLGIEHQRKLVEFLINRISYEESLQVIQSFIKDALPPDKPKKSRGGASG